MFVCNEHYADAPDIPAARPSKTRAGSLAQSKLDTVSFTTESLQEALSKIKHTHSCGPDGIAPTWFQRLCPLMLPTTFQILQGLFDSGTVPGTWQRALVTPLHKGKWKPMNELKHYRPVSITSIVCRTFERIVNGQLLNHLEKSGYLSDSQHGFRRGRSCESALATITHFISDHMDNRTMTDLIQLDLSNAFDTLDINLLLEKLTHAGIHGSLFTWISSFLRNRSQQVVYCGARSIERVISSGVPQGSVLAPTPFLVYVNDMPHNDKCILVQYADDTLIAATISSQFDARHLQNFLDEIERWISRQRLSLSTSMSSVIRFANCKKQTSPVYIVEGTPLPASDHLSILGVTCSQNLDFSAHIAGVIAKSRRTLGFITRVARPGGPAVLEALYTSLVLPSLEYCSAVWSPINNI
uniref:Reverse transcriptase domain-containing protein n=1 Tax=Ixodes ricinus TaxID=34613 RepID=A0A6B0VBN4_IXORI